MIIRYISLILTEILEKILAILALVPVVQKLTVFISCMQEIEVLVALFCLFHGCVGLILPSLARLRTMYAKLRFLTFNLRKNWLHHVNLC